MASLGFVEGGIQAALNEGVPADELINGVPFYTRLYSSDGNDTSSRAMTMPEADEWISTRGITPTWDDTACQYVVYFEDGTSISQMWLEEEESMAAKLQVMNNYNLAGVACWKLGLESNSIWEVINTYIP